jgi:amidase
MTLGPFTTALEWAGAIQAKEVSPIEVLDLYLDRVERLEPALNAFVHRADDEARETARAMGDRLIRNRDDLPPFFGVPCPIKGLQSVAGWPNRQGSLATSPDPVDDDDESVAHFRAAGFVFMGLTTSPEFGSISVTESALTGATRNPWETDHSPGGSSGGAAAAVAAAMAPVAHGSDGGGSIRVPASFTGLVGMKPSRGRVAELIVRLPEFASEGVLSRTVADTAACLDILSAHDPRRWYSIEPPPGRFVEALQSEPTRRRIGRMLRPAFDVPVDPEGIAGVDAAGELLTALGHEVVDIEWPGLDQQLFEHLFVTAWISFHGDMSDTDLAKVEPLTAEMHRQALDMRPDVIASVLDGMQEMSARCIDPWVDGEIDFMMTPTTPAGPPRIGWLFEDVDVDPMSVLRRAYHHAGFTAIVNMLGLPAVSLPLHMRPDGLPQGVQFIGAPRADWAVLQLAGQIERAAPWHDRIPPLACSSTGRTL